jgi:hypothetical protein
MKKVIAVILLGLMLGSVCITDVSATETGVLFEFTDGTGYYLGK